MPWKTSILHVHTCTTQPVFDRSSTVNLKAAESGISYFVMIISVYNRFFLFSWRKSKSSVVVLPYVQLVPQEFLYLNSRILWSCPPWWHINCYRATIRSLIKRPARLTHFHTDAGRQTVRVGVQSKGYPIVSTAGGVVDCQQRESLQSIKPTKMQHKKAQAAGANSKNGRQTIAQKFKTISDKTCQN